MQSVGVKSQTSLFDYIVTNKSIKLDEEIKNISFSGGDRKSVV